MNVQAKDMMERAIITFLCGLALAGRLIPVS